MPNGIRSPGKEFADDTSIFSKVFDKKCLQNALTRDLEIISNCAFQWKIQFNQNPNKQAIEVYFSRKQKIIVHQSLVFDGDKVQKCSSQKGTQFRSFDTKQRKTTALKSLLLMSKLTELA